MTWLSVNPYCERHIRISAAEALSGIAPENVETGDIDDYNPIYIAKLYNNAEQLELDLNSLDTIEAEEY